MQQTILSFSYTESWIYQAIQWANQFGHFFLLDYSANPKFYPQPYDMVLGVDLYEKVDFKSIATRKNDTQDFIFLGIPYEQNSYQIEHHAAHQHQVIFEPISYKPRFLLKFKDGKLIANRNYSETMGILDAIDKMPKDIPSSTKSTQRSFTDTSWETYRKQIEKIHSDIRQGLYYELNYCQSFWKYIPKNWSPLAYFALYRTKMNMPNTALVKEMDQYILSFSPETFWIRQSSLLTAYPMKGTAAKVNDNQQNQKILHDLKNSVKEKAENLIIADLMRNDLADYAAKGSLKADALYEILEFPKIFQMISILSATLRNPNDYGEALYHALPVASMTGAPKKEVLKAITRYEKFQRNLFSGILGFWEGDLSYFAVLIRTLFYDANKNLAQWASGGAITLLSEALQEYEELLLKSRPFEESL